MRIRDKIENTKIGGFVFALCEDFHGDFILPRFMTMRRIGQLIVKLIWKGKLP